MGRATDVATPAKARLAGLDLLRLLAVVLVLGRHMPLPPEAWSSEWQSVFTIWRRGGWVGVDLFFVLSGFLVSGLLFSEYKSHGRLSIGRFYTRRGWKIYPPFFALIATTILVDKLIAQPIGRTHLASEVFFLQSYIPGIWNHTWSLAVEEHFYLILPLFLIMLVRFNKSGPTPFKSLVAVSAFVAVALLTLRMLNWWYRPAYSHMTHLFPTHLRLDSLFFGVVIAYAYHFHNETFVRLMRPWRCGLIACAALLLAPAFIFPIESTPFIYTAGLTLFYLASGMLLVGVLLFDFPKTRLVTLMALLGGYSYSIYLWHMPVREWGLPGLTKLLGDSPRYGVLVMAFFVGSFLVGVVMAKLIEFPMLRLRDRWFPAGGRSPTAKPILSN